MDKLKKILSANLDSIIKPVVVLLAICIIIPFALAFTNSITEEKIAKLAAEQQNLSMVSLFPDCSFDEAELDGEKYFNAVADGKIKGYVFTNIAKGYGGDVSVMTAINADGSIKAVKILDVANETPGLGQNVTKESFYTQFAGMNGKVSIKKTNADKSKNELTPVTGATITSTAVKNAVNQAYELFTEINAQKEVAADEQ